MRLNLNGDIMARKRREGVTTYPRYKGKVYAVAYGIFHGNEEYARHYAESLATARASGFGVFKEGYRVIIPVLMKHEIPSAQWGLYRAFMCELVSKVQQKRIATVEEIIEKWRDFGLDEATLSDCASAVVQVVTKEVPTPVEKGA